MKLTDDWRVILRKAWSIRLMLLAGLLSGIEAIVPLFISTFPRGIFAAFAGTVTIAAMWARVVAQNSITKHYEKE